MPDPIINIDELVLDPRPDAFAPTGSAAARFDVRIGSIGAMLGARRLGYNLTVVPSGKIAFPFHNHHVNEEMVFVVSGSGRLRIGNRVYALRCGDVVAFPPGGKESAHQIINSGAEELRYLAVSTKLSPEIVEYPDSGKFGVLAQLRSETGAERRSFVFVGREEQSLDYWEDE